MIKRIFKIVFFITIAFCLSIQGFAQYIPSVDLSQDENLLYEQCKNQFFNEEYVQSYQGFSQLLSLYPREEVFNYYYGACIIKLNNNIKSGIDYLEYAAAKGINPANFYIGLGYHYMYDFEKALEYYELYKTNAKRKDIVNFEVEQYISMAKNGINLVKYAYELKVISSKKISRDNFYYSYNLKDFGGNIIVKTDQFKGKADKEIRELDLMYISEVHNVLFFSSYGDSKKNSLDIYMSRKEKNNWTPPQKLSDSINTKYDEAFPFLSEDGTTLYFSSKGHNSMGGYDIFRTVWDAKKNVWSSPENLDFPVNTPYDDIMYAVDRFNETAFFASTRDSKIDKITVFRILTETNPQKRKLESMSDIYQNASLQVNPIAETELAKRQEIRAVAMKDTSTSIASVQTHNDTVADADVLIQNAVAELSEKSEITAGYLEYAASAYKLTEIKLAEIKDLNKQISLLKTKTDEKSVQLKDSLTRLANAKAVESSELYNISKFFADAANQTNGLISYYRTELKVLDNTSRNEKSLLGNVKKLNNEIKNINTEFPFDTYIAGLEKEKSQKLTKLNTYISKNEPEFEKIEALNDKITIKIDLAKKETDFDVREKYVYDLKTYENEKIDIIARIKDNEIQIEFFNHDINELEQRQNLANLFRGDIEDGLFMNPGLDVSKLSNEIEILKTAVAQNSLKELSGIQDKILADLTLYSPVVDYDGILYGTSDLAETDHINIFIDTETYTKKYDNIISDKTIRTGRLITANDSLNEQIKVKEAEFDSATDDSDKQKIIADINSLQSEIDQNAEIIESGLTIENETDIATILTAYQDIKQNPVNAEINNIISETDKLIAESKSVESEIADLKELDKTGNSPGIKYLEVVKSDIDSRIALNVSDISEKQKNIVPAPDIKSIIAELEKDLNYTEKNGAAEKLLVTDLQKARKLFDDADKQKDIQKKNDLITQANAIVDRGISQSIDFFNESLVSMYSGFNAYENVYNKNNIANDKTSGYFIKAGELKKEADRLQLESEETSDEKIKVEKLAEAYKKLELANMYFDYIFDFLEDDKKFVTSKEFANSDETENLTSLVTNMRKQDTFELITETTNDIKPEIIESLINEAEIIQKRTDKLTNEFQDAAPQRQNDILEEIDNLNNELNKKIIDLNAEIVKAQKEIIIENYNRLESENPGTDFTDIEKEVVQFNEKANNSVDSKDFYLLGEVIIAGENLIKKQNDLLKSRTVLQISDAKITELLAASDRNVLFVTQQKQIASNNNINNNSIPEDTIITDTTNNITDINLTVNNDSVINNINVNNENISTDSVNNVLADNSLTSNTDSLNNITTDNTLSPDIDSANNVADNLNLIAYNDSLSNNTTDNSANNNTDSLNNIASNNNLNAYSDSLNNITTDNIVSPVDSSDNAATDNNLIANADSTDNNAIHNPVNNDNGFAVNNINSNNLTVNNDTAENHDINNSVSSSHIETLDGLVSELEKINYSNNIRELSDRQKEQESDIAVSSEKINGLKDKIAETDNKKTLAKLNQDLSNTEKSFTNILIEQSNRNLELITQLENIIKNGKDSFSLSEDTVYNNLRKKQTDQRNSIISYNNFYSTEELEEIHKKANETEMQLLEILLRETTGLNPELLAANNSNNTSTESGNTSVNINDTSGYEFEYTFDKTTASKLSKAETQIKTLNLQIQENEELMSDLEKAMENSNSMAEYKKLQKELVKAQQKYLKQIKQYAVVSKDYLTTKYSVAEIHYADNLSSAGNKIIPVSDSLKNMSDYNFRESLALFEVIISYNAKIPDKELTDKYHEASKLSGEGMNYINAANNLIIKNDINNPLVSSYYKHYEISDTLNIISPVNTNNSDSAGKDSVILVINTDISNNNDTANNVQNNLTTDNNSGNTAINNAAVESSVKTENNIFDANKESRYSDANPIKNIEHDEGLCYRIQIGAYNMVVNNDRFKGMSPIFIESIPGSKLLRYMAGIFYTFNSANSSLPVVRGMGYSDAFIVAYYQGKRITVYEARQLEENLKPEAGEILLADNIRTNQTNVITNDTASSENNIAHTGITVNNVNDTAIHTMPEVKTETDLKNTSDVFFCVQIGVFREKVGSERLYNLNPVMYDEYGNGLIRHTFGKYYDLNTAISEQNKIRQLGIKDAFVIAYSNGEKIAVNQAAGLIAGNTNLPEDQILVNVPVTVAIQPEENNRENIQPAENNQPETENNNMQNPKVEYYVQLGVFRTDVGTYVKDSFRRIAGDSKLFKLTANNMIVYRTGAFSSYDLAVTGLANANSGGVKDAFIVAFVNGKRVDIATARAAE